MSTTGEWSKRKRLTGVTGNMEIMVLQPPSIEPNALERNKLASIDMLRDYIMTGRPPSPGKWTNQPTVIVTDNGDGTATIDVSEGQADWDGILLDYEAVSYTRNLPSEGLLRLDAVAATETSAYHYQSGTDSQNPPTPPIPTGFLLANYVLLNASGGDVVEPTPAGVTLEQVQALMDLRSKEELSEANPITDSDLLGVQRGDTKFRASWGYIKSLFKAVFLGKYEAILPTGERVYSDDLQELIDQIDSGSTVVLYADAPDAKTLIAKSLTVNTNGFRLPYITDTLTPATAGDGTQKRINIAGGGILGGWEISEALTELYVDTPVDQRITNQAWLRFTGSVLTVTKPIRFKAGGLGFYGGAGSMDLLAGCVGDASGRPVIIGGPGPGNVETSKQTLSGTIRLSGRFVGNTEFGIISIDSFRALSSGSIILTNDFYGHNLYAGSIASASPGGVINFYENKGGERVTIQGNATMVANYPVISAHKSRATPSYVDVYGTLKYSQGAISNRIAITYFTELGSTVSSLTNGSNTFALTETGKVMLNGVEFAGGPSSFTPIAENQVGTHPAFSSQHELNLYLLSKGTHTPTDPDPNPEPGAVTVDAGSNKTLILPNNSTTVYGSAFSSHGTITGYLWEKTSGGAASISTPNAAETAITGLAQGVYTFRLTVTDSNSQTGTALLTITVYADSTVPMVQNASAQTNSDTDILLTFTKP